MAAGVITRSAHPDALWPGIKDWFGQSYRDVEPTWSKMFTKMSSNKYEERIAEATTFGLAPIKPEGDPLQYDSDQEGYLQRFTHTVYALGYIVTQEELEDNLYTEVSQRRAGNLAKSMRTTAEFVHANVLNRGFSAAYPIGDGKPLLSATHPTLSGNQSNLLTAADFSEAAMEDAVKQVWLIKDSRGFPTAQGVKRIIIPTNVAFNATRVLNSILRSGTANNDINALNAMGIVPEVVVDKYLSSANAWFVQTDVDDSLISMWRREVNIERTDDFDTKNAKASADMRFSCGAGDWRGLLGSPSASG
jgi:hypothetical protein